DSKHGHPSMIRPEGHHEIISFPAATGASVPLLQQARPEAYLVGRPPRVQNEPKVEALIKIRGTLEKGRIPDRREALAITRAQPPAALIYQQEPVVIRDQPTPAGHALDNDFSSEVRPAQAPQTVGARFAGFEPVEDAARVNRGVKFI